MNHQTRSMTNAMSHIEFITKFHFVTRLDIIDYTRMHISLHNWDFEVKVFFESCSLSFQIHLRC
jgi:hypothetical protein